MEPIDPPDVPLFCAALVAALGLASGCGPTLQPSAQLEELHTARDTAEAAAEAARSAEERGERVVMYASSRADGRPGPEAEPPTDEPPTDPPESQPDDRAPSAEKSETRLRTFVIERRDDRVTVLHAPYERDRAVAAFRRAVDVLREPAAADSARAPEGDRPVERKTHEAWDPDWSPDRVELDELAVTGDDRVEINGSAASDADVDELVTRLNSLEAFSDVAVESTGSVTEGQGVRFRIVGSFRAEGPQN